MRRLVEQRRWRGLCEELVLARVRIQELETRLKVLERAKPDDESPSTSILTRPDFNREVARLLALDERREMFQRSLLRYREPSSWRQDRHLWPRWLRRLYCAVRAGCPDSRPPQRCQGQLALDEFGVLLPDATTRTHG